MTPAVIVASSESPIANGTAISATAVINSSAACSAYETLPRNIAYPRYVAKSEKCVSGVTHGHPAQGRRHRVTLCTAMEPVRYEPPTVTDYGTSPS